MIHLNDFALMTDLYQLTMAYGYWKRGMAQRESVFHLFFRKLPFRGGYAISCGLGEICRYLDQYGFSKDHLAYLATLCGNDGEPLFEQAFLDELGSMKFECDLWAIPEGSVVFPHQPLIRIQGPLLQAQLLETALLNIINFQTLIATKAARICQAALGEPVLEFGLRRAQGINGGLAASRASYIGGCSATSHVWAGYQLGIPVKGTHAHSWVMAHDDELESFQSYADAMPNNCIFLVDTYDTIEGVANAIRVGNQLRNAGHEMVGVRLDSGDLAELSTEARRMLDEAGFEQASVVASNDLDEYRIQTLKARGAKINVWGVGTRLVTAYDQPALGGVYKLAALKDDAGVWQDKVKLSEQAIKVSNPGIQQVRRYFKDGKAAADVIYDATEAQIPGEINTFQGHTFHLDAEGSVDLLQEIYVKGNRIAELPDIHEIRSKTFSNLAQFSAEYLKLSEAESYPVGLSTSLLDRKTTLIRALKS
ncbi:nicotinate phosphoribosyltransferase [Pontibacter sp. G13]|uniref:nicotinate phosphoribosyltransferase n=1 Tax=Pontibacter sp. G13 TaxID=3074898 RepID=UPI00288A77A5|nr:nicotinate phosphoribosyltransferase [Pontibacter sp. G13]WNJ19962.1 nicotinate phosphoribosyltransferase [Pontibacter sp. G13]